MRITALISLGSMALSAGLALAGPPASAPASKDPMPVANPSEFHWKPKDTLPPGANAAAVYGTPAEGHYDFFGKFPAKYTVPLHWHTNDCSVVMMKGSMVIGGRANQMPDVEIKEGGFFMLPGGMKYTAHCEKECIFLVHGEKPFDIFYTNPEDDPRNAKKAEPASKEK
jgi:hypothetical protein